MDEHSNLLTEDPCGRYGDELLDGESRILDDLRRDISAGDTSWISQRIFEAQIEAAVRSDDRRLRTVLPTVVELIEGHSLLADEALSRVLDRYADCSSPDIEPSLRDASVARWGNPWLERNDSRWTLVRTSTRSMISSWLKLRLIEDFFGLLSEDGLNDQRRINFWKRYVDQISDMHFALGDAAFRDPRPDFKALRQSMKGRLLELADGGGARNNAFIMRIGGHVYVEFGEQGNAMFAFDAAQLPFDLSKSYVSGNRSALKHPSNVARIIHKDAGGERWERKIERSITALSAGRTGAAPRTAVPVSVSAKPSPTVRAPHAPAEKRAVGDLSAFLSQHGIKTSDLREKGGMLWAYAPRFGPASTELAKRGFTWADRRGAWYLRP